MPDISISNLQEATQIDQAADLFLLSQNGSAKKLKGSTLRNFLAAWLDGHGGIADIEYTAPASGSLDGTLTITLADGTEESLTVRNGKGIASITSYYARTETAVQPTSWQTSVPSLTAQYRYLWSYRRIAYNDGTYTDTAKAVIGVWGDKGDTGDTGATGATGNGISSVSKTGTSGLIDTYTVTFTNGTTTTFQVTNGASIQSIAKSSTVGLVDTYTVTLTNGSTATFTVTNAKSIASIEAVSAPHIPGQSDTYKINFNDGDYFTFSIYNGSNGAGAVSTVSGIEPIDGNVKQVSTGTGAPTTATAGNLNEIYIDLATGKLYVCLGLYDGSYSWQSAGSITIDAALSSTSENPVQNKVIYSRLSGIDSAVDAAGKTADATAVTGTKFYITGVTAQGVKQSPKSNVNCYVGTDNELYSNGGKVSKASELSAHTGNHSNPHQVTPAQIGAAKASTMSSATLAAASWVGSAAPYTYTLSVAGVTATSVVEILPGASITAAQLEALQGANIQDGGQSAGSITLKAFGDKPEIALPIRIIVRGDM